MIIEAIVATDKNLGIGKDNKLPWYNPRDLAWFKYQATRKNTILICGLNTYKSLPIHLFYDRKMAILTNSLNLDLYPNHIEYNSVESIIDDQKLFEINGYDRLLVMGGAKIYDAFKPYISKIYWTLIKETYDCDTFFPFDLFKLKEWCKPTIDNDYNLEIRIVRN